jgi:hypothetical protein
MFIVESEEEKLLACHFLRERKRTDAIRNAAGTGTRNRTAHTHTRRSNKMSTLASAASKTKLYYIFKMQGGL